MDNGGALLGGGSGARFLFFWLYDIVLAGLAAMLTAYFSPGVEGSGIPVSLTQCIKVRLLLLFVRLGVRPYRCRMHGWFLLVCLWVSSCFARFVSAIVVYWCGCCDDGMDFDVVFCAP